jgi:hypothetical protein
MYTPVSIPLIFPKIVPNHWDEWWKLWNNYKKFVPRINTSKNAKAVPWIGFDVYVKDGVDSTHSSKYKCENVNCPELFNSLFDNLDKLPIDLQVVRILQSLTEVAPHHDYADQYSIRSLLYDDNPKQTWLYENDRKDIEYLRMPSDTNTWCYDDVKVKHGTKFTRGFSKQLVLYYGIPKEPDLTTLIDDSIKKYSDYVIYL